MWTSIERGMSKYQRFVEILRTAIPYGKRGYQTRKGNVMKYEERFNFFLF